MNVNHDKLKLKWDSLCKIGKRTPGVISDYNPIENQPEWFDEKRFSIAQKLCKRYFFSLNIAHFIGNILLVLIPEVHIPIIATGQSSTVYNVFLRVLSTVLHINSWYDDNPFDPTTSTYKSLRQVRNTCHLQVTKLMNQKYPKNQIYQYLDDEDLWLSQYDMVLTQWSLIGLIAIQPNNCAFYLDQESTRNERIFILGEMIYFWRVIGYCMGIKDEFNCCSEESILENIEFQKIVFNLGYKPHLENPNPIVKNGLEVVEGVFIALNFIVPKFIISNNAFMKYWYECLSIHQHGFKLSQFSILCSYLLHRLLFDFLMRFNLIYKICSFIFFQLLNNMLKKVRKVESKIKSIYLNKNFNLMCQNGQIYSISNTHYKSNV